MSTVWRVAFQPDDNVCIITQVSQGSVLDRGTKLRPWDGSRVLLCEHLVLTGTNRPWRGFRRLESAIASFVFLSCDYYVIRHFSPRCWLFFRFSGLWCRWWGMRRQFSSERHRSKFHGVEHEQAEVSEFSTAVGQSNPLWHAPTLLETAESGDVSISKRTCDSRGSWSMKELVFDGSSPRTSKTAREQHRHGNNNNLTAYCSHWIPN